MMFFRKLFLCVGMVFFFHMASAQKFDPYYAYQPEAKMVFKGLLAVSAPSPILNGGGHLPNKYYTGIYRIPAMGVRFRHHEVLVAPVFIFMPAIYTIGSRGMLLHYTYDINSPNKKNTLYAGADVMYSNVIYRYRSSRFNTDVGISENTLEGSLNMGMRHNFSDHINVSAYAGSGMRSTHVKGYNRPIVYQLGVALGLVL